MPSYVKTSPEHKLGEYRVFIAGVEAPTVAVSVTTSVNTIPQASLTLVPHPVLLRLGHDDRVPVQIFYWDQWYKPDEPTYRLLFDGEIFSWNYTRTSNSRSIQFQCIGVTSVLTQFFIYFVNDHSDMVSQMGINTNGARGKQTTIGAELLFMALVHKGLRTSDSAVIDIPFEYVNNVLNIIYNDDIAKDHLLMSDAIQDWTEVSSEWMKKYVEKPYINLRNRFVKSPLIEDNLTIKGVENQKGFPLLKAWQDSTTFNFILESMKGIQSSLPKNASFYDVMTYFLPHFYFELLQLSTPAMVGTFSEPVKEGEKQESIPGTIFEGGDRVLTDKLAQNITKPQWAFGVPPACNIIFPSMITQMSYEENFWLQPTRTYLSPEHYLFGRNSNTGLDSLSRIATMVAWPEEIYELTTNRESAIELEATVKDTVKPNISREDAAGNPEEIVSKNFIPDEDYNMYKLLVMHPGFTGIPGGNSTDASREAGILKYNKFKEENGEGYPGLELYKGPVTQNVSSPAWLYYLNGYLVNQPSREDTKDDDRNKTHTFLRHLVKYEHEKAKFESRSGGIGMVFNPYVTAGFTCAVFDDLEAGFHFYGYVDQVVHNLSSSSVSTSVSFSSGQTMQENLLFYVKVARERAKAAGKSPELAIDNGPELPFDFLRDYTQTFAGADTYFRALFGGISGVDRENAEEANEKNFAFNYKDFFILDSKTGDPRAFFDHYSGSRGYSGLVPENGDIAPEDPIRRFQWGQINQYRDSEYIQRDKLKYFTDHNRALEFISRPICTLYQYYIGFAKQGNLVINSLEGEENPETVTLQDTLRFVNMSDVPPSTRQQMFNPMTRRGEQLPINWFYAFNRVMQYEEDEEAFANWQHIMETYRWLTYTDSAFWRVSGTGEPRTMDERASDHN